MLTVATFVPAGCTAPRLESQIMISDPSGCPQVALVVLVHRS